MFQNMEYYLLFLPFTLLCWKLGLDCKTFLGKIIDILHVWLVTDPPRANFTSLYNSTLSIHTSLHCHTILTDAAKNKREKITQSVDILSP